MVSFPASELLAPVLVIVDVGQQPDQKESTLKYMYRHNGR